jgi:indole-3-glycerol phosphate synthase
LSASVDFLEEIVGRKRLRVEAAKLITSPDQMSDAAFAARNRASPNALRERLSGDERIKIIAEFKRRSPSKGIIRSDVDPSEIARCYAAGGAVGISVLTEEDYFGGSLEDLKSVKAAVDLPVLRKDFVFDSYQVYQAAAAGADAILLIAAALDDQSLFRLRELAEDDLGIDALVEVHNEEEMQRGADCGATLIGVNNRDLRTFKVSLEVSITLAALAPADVVMISESGLRTPADLRRLGEVGYRGFLIGESLMRAQSPEEALRLLVGE